MATFFIKRNDTAPPLVIAMRVANSGDADGENVEYWDGGNYKADGEREYTIKSTVFTMTNEDTGYKKVNRGTGFSRTIEGRTEIGYAWKSTVGDTDMKDGEIPISGEATYRGEFEITFEATGGDLKKRTFPSVPGDELLIKIYEDLDGV